MTRVLPVADVVDESDAYLEAKLRFGPGADALYCYFQDLGGPDNGYVEVGFNADTGDIARVTVLTRPTSISPFPTDVPVVEGSIRVDLDRWSELAAADDPRINFVKEHDRMAVCTRDNAVYYAFSRVYPTEFVRSGPAGFAVCGSELTGFVTGLS